MKDETINREGPHERYHEREGHAVARRRRQIIKSNIKGKYIMPMIQIELLEGRSPEKINKMIKDMTDACMNALQCPRDVVKIIVREMKHTHYAVGGITWAEQENKPYSM